MEKTKEYIIKYAKNGRTFSTISSGSTKHNAIEKFKRAYCVCPIVSINELKDKQ